MTKEVGNSTLLDTWAATGEKVEPSDIKKDVGWELQEQPPHEYANWLANSIGQAVNHILQNGVPAHNTTTTYAVGNLVQVAGVLYQAKAINTNSVPPNVNWQQLAPYPVKNSLNIDAGAMQLVNDQSAPGANKLYGTNGAGQKGWQNQIVNGFETGDFKIAYGTAEKSGYVRCNGRSIGSAASAATERANADTAALFTHLWDTNSALVVSGGRGASAAEDYEANKTITLPDARNNVLAFVDGMGHSNTNRLTTENGGTIDGKTLGSIGGAQTHILNEGELAEHNHNVPSWRQTQIDPTGGSYAATSDPGGGGNAQAEDALQTMAAGDGDPHNNTQPTLIAGTLYIKL